MKNQNKNTNNKWVLTLLLLIISLAVTYFTKIWFLLLLVPLGMFSLKKNDD